VNGYQLEFDDIEAFSFVMAFTKPAGYNSSNAFAKTMLTPVTRRFADNF